MGYDVDLNEFLREVERLRSPQEILDASRRYHDRSGLIATTAHRLQHKTMTVLSYRALMTLLRVMGPEGVDAAMPVIDTDASMTNAGIAIDIFQKSTVALASKNFQIQATKAAVHPCASVRGAVAYVLGRTKRYTKLSERALTKLSKDDDASVRRSATRSLRLRREQHRRS